MFALSSALLVLLQLVPATLGAVIPLSNEHPHHGKGLVSRQTQMRGTFRDISGVRTYVSMPGGSFDKSAAIVLLTDVFGLAKVDNLLLADSFALNGFVTYAPDYLNGDPFPENMTKTFQDWLPLHGQAQTIPPMNTVIARLRADGVLKLGVSGYCFGGLYTTLLAQNNSIDAAVMSHPSLLQVPEDFNKLKASSRVPIQINNAELDMALTPALAFQVDTVMANGQYLPGYERQQFQGVAHGFATSADPTNQIQITAKDGALRNALNFFRLRLNVTALPATVSTLNSGAQGGVNVGTMGHLAMVAAGLVVASYWV